MIFTAMAGRIDAVAPLAGAWIETGQRLAGHAGGPGSLPSRERGLKRRRLTGQGRLA